MNNKKIMIMGFLMTVIISLSCLSMNISEEISTSSGTLSNKKIGWGIKRNDNNTQPDLGAENTKLISENNGIAMGNSEKPYIYITFDLGYEAGYTEKILDALKENDVKGTFFITAHYLNTAENIVKRMIDEGHIVGNHTVNHKSMPDITDAELEEEVMKLHHAVYEKFGYEMKYLRPPKGEFSERTLSLTNSLGYKTVMWSFAYVDWDENKQPSQEDGLNKVVSNLHNGEIMLLHATSKTNSEIIDSVIKNRISNFATLLK